MKFSSATPKTPGPGHKLSSILSPEKKFRTSEGFFIASKQSSRSTNNIHQPKPMSPEFKNPDDDEGIPKSTEIIFTSFQNSENPNFQTFGEAIDKKNFLDCAHQLPSPLHRITYSLQHNYSQKNYLDEVYNQNHNDAVTKVLEGIRIRELKEGQMKIKVRSKEQNQPIPVKKPEEEEKTADQLSKKKTIDHQMLLPLQQQTETVRIIPPLFYQEIQHLPKDSKTIRPSFVEGTAMVVQNDKMYVYGGLGGNGMKNSLVEYNLKTSQWREIVLNGIPPSEGRTGHSVVCFRSSLYFFGGSLMYNRRVKHRESFNTIYQLQLSNFVWMKIQVQGDYFSARRHHKACLYSNKYMLIYGGVDTNEQVLSDMALFNIEKSVMKYLGEIENQEIAYHSLINVSKLQETNKKQVEFDSIKEKFPMEQIYCFGGKDKNSQTVSCMKKLSYHPSFK